MMCNSLGRTVLALAAMSLPMVLCAQTDGARPSDGEIYEFVNPEVQPEFPGGEKAMMIYLAKNLKHPVCVEREGTVIVGFTVETDGRLTDVRTLRGVASVLDNEAVRVVKGMPPWTPGKRLAKPVKVNYVLPVQFRISR